MTQDHKKRGEPKTDQEIAVEWLNAAFSSPKGKPAYKSVLSIYTLSNDLIDGYAEYERASASHSPESYNLGKMLARLAAQHTALNKALAKYRLIPQTQYLLEPAQWFTFNVSQKGKNDFEIPLDSWQRGITINEGSAVSALLALVRTGDLWRARLCPMCRERWKVQVRPIDKFCSNHCRIRFRQSTPEGREQHRKAMRKHRKSEGFKINN